jgi:hypothetical protein
MWKTCFAGQNSHRCPHCRKNFRLTYNAKIRVAGLNLILILGPFIALAWPQVERNMLIYLGIAVVVLLVLPTQLRYQTMKAAYSFDQRKK